MKEKLSLKVIAISVALVLAIVVCAVVLYSSINGSKTNGRNVLTSLLEAPLFISSAEASAATMAFPTNEAGLAAYVKVPKVDIEKMKSIFALVEKIGDNFIYGVTSIKNLDGNINMHVYADTDGWLVGYIRANEPAASIMNWGGMVPNNPQVGIIQYPLLEAALDKAGTAIGAGASPKDIKYYDFRSPEATGMALFIKGGSGYGTKISTMQVELPATYTLYEASYSHLSNYYSELKVDGIIVSTTSGDGWKRNIGSYGGAIKTGVLHTIELSGKSREYIPSNEGVATVLIYKSQ